MRPDPEISQILSAVALKKARFGQRVYWVQGVDGGPVKIGTSIDSAQRLRALQAYSPVRLELRCEVPGGPTLEALLHRQHGAQRLHGEWFEPDGVLEVAQWFREFLEWFYAEAADSESELHLTLKERAMLRRLVFSGARAGWSLEKIARECDLELAEVTETYEYMRDRGYAIEPPVKRKTAPVTENTISRPTFDVVDDDAPLW